MNIHLQERTETHVKIYFQKAQASEIKKYLPQKAKTLEEALADFQKTLSPNAKSYGKTIYINDQYIGDIWCYAIDLSETPNAMISYCIFEKKFHNQGIATKALALFMKEIFTKFPFKTLGAFTFASNIASIKVLEKNRFQHRETIEENGTVSFYFQYE